MGGGALGSLITLRDRGFAEDISGIEVVESARSGEDSPAGLVALKKPHGIAY